MPTTRAKKIITIAALALIRATHAFTLPAHLISPPQKRPASHSTTFLRLADLSRPADSDNEDTTSFSLEGNQQSSFLSRIPFKVVGVGGGSLLLFSAVNWFLQKSLIEPYLRQGPKMCAIYAESLFFLDHPLSGFILILTHAIPFVLLPITMRLVYDKGPEIQKNHPEFNPFIVIMGLASICFGLAFEFSYHINQSWYYLNSFTAHNFGFYFFLISGFSLWADGLKSSKRMDRLFFAILLAATILYPLGANQVLHPKANALFLKSPNSAKIPLYTGMTATFTSLTQRGWKVFGSKMGWVFFFSVIVNLVFIFLLQSLPAGTLDVKNYIYHMCHDLLGTEMGIAVFAYLVATYDPVAQAARLAARKQARAKQ